MELGNAPKGKSSVETSWKLCPQREQTLSHSSCSILGFLGIFRENVYRLTRATYIYTNILSNLSVLSILTEYYNPPGSSVHGFSRQEYWSG